MTTTTGTTHPTTFTLAELVALRRRLAAAEPLGEFYRRSSAARRAS